jgi:hypothetical protein
MSQTTLKRPLSFAALVVIAVLIAGAPRVHAGEWEWEIAPYIWFTDVGVDVSLNETDIAGTTVESEMDQIIGEVGGIYRLNGDDRGLDLLFGARVLDVSIDVSFDFPSMSGLADRSR